MDAGADPREAPLRHLAPELRHLSKSVIDWADSRLVDGIAQVVSRGRAKTAHRAKTRKRVLGYIRGCTGDAYR